MLLRIFAVLLILLLILQCAGCLDVQLHTAAAVPRFSRSENAVDATKLLPETVTDRDATDRRHSRWLGRCEVLCDRPAPACRQRAAHT
jgi:hypothetical protein